MARGRPDILTRWRRWRNWRNRRVEIRSAMNDWGARANGYWLALMIGPLDRHKTRRDLRRCNRNVERLSRLLRGKNPWLREGE